MPTLAQAFNQFKDNLKVPDGLREQVTKRQTRLRTTLVQDPNISAVIIGGSWARGTRITPLNDIDLLVVLNKAPGDPQQTLEWLLEHASRLYKDTECRPQKRSIGIRFGDFGFDLVPAIPLSEGGYKIPTRDGHWLKTNPKKAQKFAGERDQASNQMAIPLVKMFKCWKRQHSLELRSFHLEVLVLKSLAGKPPSYAEGARRLFRALPGELEKPCYDPARLGRLDDGYLSKQGLDDALEAAERCASHLEQAIQADAKKQIAPALTLCRQVFGTPFPG